MHVRNSPFGADSVFTILLGRCEDMEMAKVTSKGQITIPVSIRRRLNIDEGDKLLFIDRPEGVIMVNPDMLPGGTSQKEAKQSKAPKKKTSAPGKKASETKVAAEVSEPNEDLVAPVQAVVEAPVTPPPPAPIEQVALEPVVAHVEPTAPSETVAPPPQPVAQPEVAYAPPPQPVAQPEVAYAPPPQPVAQPEVAYAPPAQPVAQPEVAYVPPAQPVAQPEVAYVPPAQPAAETMGEQKPGDASPHGLDLHALLSEIRSIGSNI